MIKEAYIADLPILLPLLNKLNPTWNEEWWKELFLYGIEVSNGDLIGYYSCDEANHVNGFIGVIPSPNKDFANCHSWIVEEGTGLLALTLLKRIKKEYKVLTNYSASPKPRAIFEALKWNVQNLNWINYYFTNFSLKEKNHVSILKFNLLRISNQNSFSIFKIQIIEKRLFSILQLKFVGGTDEQVHFTKIDKADLPKEFRKFNIVSLVLPSFVKTNALFSKRSLERERIAYSSSKDFDLLASNSLLNSELPIIL